MSRNTGWSVLWVAFKKKTNNFIHRSVVALPSETAFSPSISEFDRKGRGGLVRGRVVGVTIHLLEGHPQSEPYTSSLFGNHCRQSTAASGPRRFEEKLCRPRARRRREMGAGGVRSKAERAAAAQLRWWRRRAGGGPPPPLPPTTATVPHAQGRSGKWPPPSRGKTVPAPVGKRVTPAQPEPWGRSYTI